MLQIHLILGLVLLGMIFPIAHAQNYQIAILDGTSKQESGLKFYPETLPFSGDDTITWKNEDSTPHSITSGIGAHPEYSGKFFKTGTISPGKSGSAKIDVKQNFAFYYFCELHPWLAGKLVVDTAPESQPETTNPIVTTGQIGSDVAISGQVHLDFRKTPYDILTYQGDTLVDVKHGIFDDAGAYVDSIKNLSPGQYTLKIVYGLPTQIGTTQIQVSEQIPSWIRTNAKWWSEGITTDTEFVKAIQYLAKEKVIKLSKGDATNSDAIVPAWLKTSAGWWASGQISDTEFAKSLQYLSDNGIIQI